MADIIDTLLEQPRKNLIAGWIFSLVVVAFLFHYFVLSAQAAAIEEAKEEMQTMRSTLFDLRSKVKRLKRLKETKEKLEERITQAEKELPEKEEMPQLLSTLSGLAKSSGLDIKLWRSEQERHEDYFVELPVSVKVAGGYQQVATFFDEVGRLDRIVNVQAISMSDPQIKSARDVRISTEFTLTTFRQLTLEEREQREAEEKNRRRGRRPSR